MGGYTGRWDAPGLMDQQAPQGYMDRLEDWWANSLTNQMFVQPLISAATLPGDVYAGRVDPRSDEAIERSADLAGAVTLGAGAVPAEANAPPSSHRSRGHGLPVPRKVHIAPR